MIFNKKDNIKSFIQYSKDEANKQRLINVIKLLYSKEVDSLMLKHIESFIFGCIELKQSKIKEHCKYELRNNLLVIKGGL